MKEDEHLYTLILSRTPGIGLIGAHHLLSTVGNAKDIVLHAKELAREIPGFPDKAVEALCRPDLLQLCEAELSFAEKNGIQCLIHSDNAYPSRLRECPDAPIALFYKGNADLNSLHIVSIVGTRHATDYGKETCSRFIHELKELMPDVIIVSGLAYGIDVQAHRAALENGLATIGVLAHGLDRIYPATHRRTAVEMLEQGGLLTEFTSGTNPDKQNFVKRNRIVAGISDATIVVESAEKGGSLITADIAESYHKDCFAFPGRISDTFSIGCNNLIRQNKAALLQHAEDFVKAMCWDVENKKPEATQRQLFPDLSPDETKIVQLLEKEPEGKQINTLVVESNIAINRLTGILFELEMKGVIRAMAGGMYKLLA